MLIQSVYLKIQLFFDLIIELLLISSGFDTLDFSFAFFSYLDFYCFVSKYESAELMAASKITPF